ncbi:hypothetical protein M2347_002604 [Chryseobacterium sp. H1D6B]|uniref:hypothetical protein n=1 Tax=Chryseobacterium sp. H1D6B TaxID=2940588 RepID=UPI0015CB6BFA|nr:hypothetical protein [Chryseobacterium sp. H1D6B]MDH6252877.1 hypothetical protein [Chryseobacterium sp. H1D6B]
MKKKLFIQLLLFFTSCLALYSCIHDDVNSLADSSSKEYTNKSLWKQDEKYIKNVMQVYQENEDKIKKTSGTPYWDYASTLESFDETFLMVPVVESGRVVSVMQVPRHGSKISFYYTNFKNQTDFFQTLVFAKYKKASDASSETDIVCKTVTVAVWLPDSESNPDPGSGAGHWGTHSVIKCKQVLDNCSGVVGPDGQCITGGNTDDPGEFPYPGGGGNPETPETPEDPCEKTKTSITNANNVFKNSDVKQKMDVILKGKTLASNEWAVAIGQKPNGYEVTPAVEQNPTSGTVPNSLLTTPYIGDGHSHGGGFGNPSAGDLYGMLNSILTNPGLKYRYVYGDYFGTPEVYVLVVDDSTLSNSFLTNYPKNENYDPSTHSFLDGSSVGTDFFNINNLYGNGTFISEIGDIRGSAAGLAYILDKYNAGISLAKVDSNGNLKRVNVKKENIVVPGGNGSPKEGLNIINCP